MYKFGSWWMQCRGQVLSLARLTKFGVNYLELKGTI